MMMMLLPHESYSRRQLRKEPLENRHHVIAKEQAQARPGKINTCTAANQIDLHNNNPPADQSCRPFGPFGPFDANKKIIGDILVLTV
jgi:hypothetical protein